MRRILPGDVAAKRFELRILNQIRSYKKRTVLLSVKEECRTEEEMTYCSVIAIFDIFPCHAFLASSARTSARVGNSPKRVGESTRGAARASSAMAIKKNCVDREAQSVFLVDAHRFAGTEILHSDALSDIFSWALSVSDLFHVSIACKRWLRTARSAEPWADHHIDISQTSICSHELQRWWPIWHMSKFVHLTYSHRDTFEHPYPSPYLVRHEWGRWPSSAAYNDWHDIRLGGRQWLVMLTQQEVPDTVSILQGKNRFCCFKTTLVLGWTTARSPKSLSRLWCSRELRRQESADEVISVRVCQKGFSRAQCPEGALPGQVMKLYLDRKSRTMALKTFANRYVTLQRPPLDASVAPHRRLRFFLAMPRPVGTGLRRLPSAALQPTEYSHSDI